MVATKIGHPPLDDLMLRRLDAQSLREDIDEALVNLGMAQLELVYLHRDDPNRPVDEIPGALEELCSSGLIR